MNGAWPHGEPAGHVKRMAGIGPCNNSTLRHGVSIRPRVDAELSCEGSDGAANTAPVGSYSANDAGLFDMVGNVSERVERQEMYRALYVHSQVARGGAWVDAAESLRSSARTALGPRHRFSFVGFRVARTLN